MVETPIVTYSPKYAAYQRKIREGQIERTQKILCSPEKKRKGKNPNVDPMRFVKRTTVTSHGEIAENAKWSDREQIEKEARTLWILCSSDQSGRR